MNWREVAELPLLPVQLYLIQSSIKREAVERLRLPQFIKSGSEHFNKKSQLYK